jgi:hypothetical protein
MVLYFELRIMKQELFQRTHLQFFMMLLRLSCFGIRRLWPEVACQLKKKEAVPTVVQQELWKTRLNPRT